VRRCQSEIQKKGALSEKSETISALPIIYGGIEWISDAAWRVGTVDRRRLNFPGEYAFLHTTRKKNVRSFLIGPPKRSAELILVELWLRATVGGEKQ